MLRTRSDDSRAGHVAHRPPWGCVRIPGPVWSLVAAPPGPGPVGWRGCTCREAVPRGPPCSLAVPIPPLSCPAAGTLLTTLPPGSSLSRKSSNKSENHDLGHSRPTGAVVSPCKWGRILPPGRPPRPPTYRRGTCSPGRGCCPGGREPGGDRAQPGAQGVCSAELLTSQHPGRASLAH